MDEYQWVPTNLEFCSSLEKSAVQGGHEAGDPQVPIYVGRVEYSGELIPCKVVPARGAAFVGHDKQEIAVAEFEMFCKKSKRGRSKSPKRRKSKSPKRCKSKSPKRSKSPKKGCKGKVRWVAASNGDVPPGAVAAGRASNGEALYVGRAHEQGSLTPGKVHPSHQCCYIPFGGIEISHRGYEVMVIE